MKEILHCTVTPTDGDKSATQLLIFPSTHTHTRLTLTLVAHHIQSLLVSQHIQTLTQTLLLFPLTFLLLLSLSLSLSHTHTHTHTHAHTHIKDYFWPREETLNSGYDPDFPLSLWTQ